MIPIFRSARAAALLGACLVSLAGCKMDVTNPTVIDANAFNPATDPATASLSAQQNFYIAYGYVTLLDGYLADEMWTAAARAEDKAIAQRQFDYTSIDINYYLWARIGTALTTNEHVVASLANGPKASSDVNLARSAMNSGFIFTLLAEDFCSGVVSGGPSLTDAQMLDSAITRFQQAATSGAGAAAAGVAEGKKIQNASLIGLARAYLQKGDYANASKTAAQEIALDPAGTFAYSAQYSSTNGGLYYNTVYSFSASLQTVVPAMYRALNDVRVPWKDAGKKAADGQIEFFQQLKYNTYGDPIRVASTLEAKYIQAEADLKNGNSATATALIAARQAASPSATYLPSTASTLSQLEDVRVRDFWMEAKKLGDWRRNPNDTPYIDPAGAPFYESGTTLKYGNASCFPIPIEEINANRNLTAGS